MDLCSNNHQEICYDERKCPLCEMKKEIEQKDDTISELNEEVKRLNKFIEHLENENTELQKALDTIQDNKET